MTIFCNAIQYQEVCTDLLNVNAGGTWQYLCFKGFVFSSLVKQSNFVPYNFDH